MGTPPNTYGKLTLRLAPSESAGPHDIIWAAGIFEGEGHARRAPTTEQVIIGQKDRWLCDRLRALFGGNVHYRPRDDAFVWIATGARARGFLMSIYQMLSPRKRAQIRETLRVT